ncbi:MAG: hypothetical protein JXA67_11660 [Micromonosporaceae bacterium]|nr:hypothetical protein [Micromonosporaceae bacterium]
MGDLPGLLERLSWLEHRIRAAVVARRATDPAPDDAFRGLYLSEEAIDELLAGERGPFPADPQSRAPRAPLLPGTVRLEPLDTELLLIALAPDIDSRFEQFYGYLNDDVTRRRPTVGLALRLCGLPEASVPGRGRLHADAPLISGGMLVLDDHDRPLLSRTMRVPERVVGHLLGDDRPDPVLAGLIDLGVRGADGLPGADGLGPVNGLPGVARLADALGAGVAVAYLRERPGGSGVALAVTALDRLGLPAIVADATRLAARPELAQPLLREALLRQAGVVLGPVDAHLPGVLAAFTGAGVPLVLHGPANWDPRWAAVQPLTLDVDPVPADLRAAVWREALNGRLAPGVDPAAVTAHFVLCPQQIRAAASAAGLAALAGDGRVTADLLRQGARRQNAAGLERLARRIHPAVTWDDLVLPPAVTGQLREVAARARHRDQVLDQWRMRPGGGRGQCR